MKNQGTLPIKNERSRRAARWLCALTVGILTGTVFSASAADSTGDLSAMADYSRWIKPWSEHTNTSSRLGAELKVVVTIVTGEQLMSVVTNLSPVERLNLAYHLKTASSEIATNGACWSYFASNLAVNEAPIRQLTASMLQQVDQLLKSLPDDGLSLPPPGQRIIVQVWEQDHWRIRVYDRAAAPLEVRALLVLIGNPFDSSL